MLHCPTASDWHCCACSSPSVQADTPLFSADGYRMSLYRSPTPDHLPGATILSTPRPCKPCCGQSPAPVLIDVYRRQWLQGRFIEDQPHANLPGSHWLANTGDGDLTPEWQSYFRAPPVCLQRRRPARDRWSSTAAPIAG